MPVFYHQIKAMGTLLDIVVPDLSEGAGQKLAAKIEDELQSLQDCLSSYKPDSELSRLNRSAFHESLEVSVILSSAIQQGMHFHRLTQGFFDFSLGAWTSLPDKKDLNLIRLREFTSQPMNKRIALKGNTVRFLHPDTILDMGGLGKGIALSGIEKILRNGGINAAFISFGGSGVLAVGSHPYGDCWKLGVQNPMDDSQMIGELDLVDECVSISGNSSNNRHKFGADGHIIDPFSGAFNNTAELIAVVSKDPLEAEVLSTAVFAGGSALEAHIIEEIKTIKIKRFSVNG